MRTGKITLKDLSRYKSRPGRYGDGGGLYLIVDSPSSAYFAFRFTSPVTKRERWHGLGSLATFSLQEARERARKARQAIADGVDPVAERRTTSAITFEDAAKKYLADHEEKWSSQKHSDQFLSTLRAYAFPKLGDVDVRDIDTAIVLDVLKVTVAAKGKLKAGPLYLARPETSSRLRMRIEWVLDWSAAHNYRSGENPARREVIAAALPRPARSARHFASMPYTDVPAFMVELRKRQGIAARALEFLILNASRTGEVTGALWTEFGEGVWTIPAERMKAREAHRVPLSPQALSLLAELPREIDNDAVFIGPRNAHLSNAAMSAVMERMGVGHFTVHGFRASFRTWAEECTAHLPIVAEMSLAHKVDSKLVNTYRRTDLLAKRRALMADWSNYLSGNVIELRPKSVLTG